MKFIKIQPFDTLFFRDGKPFTMGVETWSDVIFPPSPSVLYGALRSVYFSENPEQLQKGDSIENENYNTSDISTHLKVKLISLYNEEKKISLFPLPLDMVKREDNNKFIKLILKKKEESIISNYPLNYYLTTGVNIDVKTVSMYYITSDTLQQYLWGDKEEFSAIELSEILVKEPKIGIGRSRKNYNIEEGKLYRVDLIRLLNTSIIIGFDDLEIRKEGFIRLGGEAKGSYYKEINNIIEDEKPKNFKIKNNKFKLYFITPAIFDNGYFPSWIHKEDNFRGEYNGIKVRLIAVSVGKYLNIGGFDMKIKWPKKMFRAIPSGSIFYFEIEDSSIKEDNIIKSFHNQAISDKKSQEGYGLVKVGNI